jgi:hypothetical protein
MKAKKIKVGVDFDGVLAYNPFRVIRAPVAFVKKNVLGQYRTKFWIPKTSTEKAIWKILHESSVFPGKGMNVFRQMIDSGEIEAHLVTARYSFLQNQLFSWLRRHDLERYFTSITLNERDEQPHIYKARVVKEKGFDYFIEDNLDVVEHLQRQTPETKTLWVYNILDRNHPYKEKFPHLLHALMHIRSQKKS